MKKFIILFLFINLFLISKERDYQLEFAKKYNCKTEIVLSDNTRVDIIYDEYVIEVDYSKKWYEAVGQCLWYSIQTGKKPSILLIVDGLNDKYLIKLLILAKVYDIKVFTIDYNTFEINEIN